MLQRRFSVLIAIGLLLGACKSKDDTAPAPTAPWEAPRPAAPSTVGSGAAAPRAPLTTRYRVEPSSVMRVRIPAKEAEPSGVFRVISGALDVDLRQLENSRGTIDIDLGSILMSGDRSGSERDYTQRARSWLNLGDARPDAEVERVRVAHFTIQRLSKLSAPAAHLGKPTKGDAANTLSGERRAITFSALGQLEMNDRRVTREASLVAEFDYPSAAQPDSVPSRIRVTTTRFVEVPLAEHDIVPRDSAGRLVSGDLGLLGRMVGHTARVDTDLVLVLANQR